MDANSTGGGCDFCEQSLAARLYGLVLIEQAGGRRGKDDIMYGFGMQEIIILAVIGTPIVVGLIIYLLIRAARHNSRP